MDIFQFSDKNPQASVAYASTDVMHTSAEVILPYFCKEESERIISDLWDELRREDAVFNRFARSSDIARINESGEAVSDGSLAHPGLAHVDGIV
ncbi:MAG: hypothetical protein HUJ93_06230, partial [Bacteroidales bacterium]|nr:hypothetical protein [Bacteroidales bacterium]